MADTKIINASSLTFIDDAKDMIVDTLKAMKKGQAIEAHNARPNKTINSLVKKGIVKEGEYVVKRASDKKLYIVRV